MKHIVLKKERRCRTFLLAPWNSREGRTTNDVLADCSESACPASPVKGPAAWHPSACHSPDVTAAVEAAGDTMAPTMMTTAKTTTRTTTTTARMETTTPHKQP